MSTKWNDDRMMPWNPIKTNTWNAHWGKGEFTCVHSLNDAEGPWWRANLETNVVITKIKILNRGDCCAKRLNGAKVFVGDNLCGTVKEAKLGKWITLKCKSIGNFIKI